MPELQSIKDHPLLGPLREFQRVGVAHLCSRSGALLADEMGLGKTAMAIVAMAILRDAGLIRRALVVTPTSLGTNWQRELAMWAPDLAIRRVIGAARDRGATYALPVPVLIASYQQIRLDIQAILAERLEWDLVVLDEAQWIKNPLSATNLACRRLRRSRSWALSATPLENRPEEFSAVLNFVSPRQLNGLPSRRELHAATSTLFLRRRKADVLAELPPILIQDLPMELLPEQESSYKEVAYEASRAAAFGGSASFLLARITELKKICNFDPETGASCKLEALTDIADSIDGAGGKLLIFSQYVQTLRKIQKSLPIPATLYYGGLAIPERDEIVRAFKEEPGPRALLISLKAGGVGLNLPNASHVVMFDRWWNPAVEMQAIQRAHRFGRSSRLHVIRFLVINTIEERIVRLLHDKQDMFEDLVEDAPSATTRIGLLKELLVLK